MPDAYIDHRVHSYTYLKKEVTLDGIVYPIGEIVNRVKSIETNGRHIITFPIPSMESVYLDLACQNWERSEIFIKKIDKSSKFKSDNYLSNLADSPEQVFDFFENRISAIIFSVSAIEVFSNHCLYNKSFISIR